jgi:hypothetical protein
MIDMHDHDVGRLSESQEDTAAYAVRLRPIVQE